MKNNKIIQSSIKKIGHFLVAIFLLVNIMGCDDYLDVIPDNIPNLDHVFVTQDMAENYLATLYSRAPTVDLISNILFMGTDDVWSFEEDHYSYHSPWRIASGEQNANSPLVNAWEGTNHIKNLWQGIRDCNIFLEEIVKPERLPDMSDYKRKRWIAEAKFMKAYLHFYLFRMYGPIPLMEENVPVSATITETRKKRDPVDKVVQYLSDLLDEAAPNLPITIEDAVTENGRVTRGAAYMLKAKLWVTAASPLFNGNSDYKDFIDHDGEHLFPVNADPGKWVKAVEACEQALENMPNKELYYYKENAALSAATIKKMSLRCAITERFNQEVIWTRPTAISASSVIQLRTMPPNLDSNLGTTYSYTSSYLSPTFSIVERFYTKNGVPINEDKDWDYADRYHVATASGQGYNVIDNYQTAKLNLDRENRFYASVAFDGALVYLNKSKTDDNAYPIRAKFGQAQGTTNSYLRAQYVTATGYYVIKLTNPEFTHVADRTTPATIGGKWYPWPEFRLADLYLLYAEALCETGDLANARKFVNRVRERSGLETVEDSWRDHSIDPDKPNRQTGLRAIVHQEREIELAFEGHRMWDLRRWKETADYQNKPIKGWNVMTKTAEEYYQPLTLHEMKFVTPRDYLWPISTAALQRNPALVQNPGW